MPMIAPRKIEDLRPDQRALLEGAIRRNVVNTPNAILTMAHSERLLEQTLGGLDKFPYLGFDAVFGADFCELMRLRSAQLGGCEGCQKARYTDNSEALVCAIDTPQNLGRREQLALKLMNKMHTDHFAIDRAFFVELAEVFSTREIVELGTMISGMVGSHRWMHALDLLGEGEPVCGADEVQAV